MPARPHLSIPTPGSRRAVVVGAGSFGTATAALLAGALVRAGVDAPVTNALNQLIAGELPLEEWVAQVRATVPPPGRFGEEGA